VELRSRGSRLLLDVGMPLDHELGSDATLPESLDLNSAKPIVGVVISHPHADHYGLAKLLPPDTHFLMGAAAERILRAAAVFTDSGASFRNVSHLKDREKISIGPFIITPYLMDHSAYDSYALHVECDGKGLFYTGDLRAHGRKGALFEKLIHQPPLPVDVLLMEGTTLSREKTETGFLTESDLESRFVEIFESTQGMPLVWCSGQNIDRLVTVFRACKRVGRQLILDMYTAHVLAATENPRVPQASWDGIRVFLPHFQKLRIKRDRAFDVATQYRPYRIFPEDLKSSAPNSVMLFRPSMRSDMEKAACLKGTCLVYSMWDGYLRDERMLPFRRWLDFHSVPLYKCHTSGHASVKDLKRLCAAFPGAAVVPIHTPTPEIYDNMFGNVRVHQDGEFWDL
jgi:ribonuclease J